MIGSEAICPKGTIILQFSQKIEHLHHIVKAIAYSVATKRTLRKRFLIRGSSRELLVWFLETNKT